MGNVESLWIVDLDRDAVGDLAEVKSRGEFQATLTAMDKLERLGPRLTSPNMKSLKGEADLFELRPKRGACPVRPIYVREGRRFVVLAVAPNKASFASAVARARQRLALRRQLR